MNPAESKYIENKAYLARAAREGRFGPRHSWARQATEFLPEEQWFRCVKEEFPKYVPFLTERCGLEFRGRVLEIGAGGAWFSAELSKLPRVVEVIATDPSPQPLKEHAPKVFKLLNAQHRQDHADAGGLPSAWIFRTTTLISWFARRCCTTRRTSCRCLREAKRVLKPGGQFVAIREPVWPLVKIKSRAKMLAKLVATGVNERFYTLADYKEFFKQAALPLQVKRVNLSRGFKYYVNKVVNGLTHARYAFVGTKRGR